MEKTPFVLLPVEELQSIIIDCVNSCLKYNQVNLPDPQPELLTVREAAELLNLAVPTVYSMVSRNEIPFMKRQKRLYFSREELTNYIKAGRNITSKEREEAVHDRLAKIKGGAR